MPKAFILCKVTNIIWHSHRLSTSTFTLTSSLLNPYLLWVKIHKEKGEERKRANGAFIDIDGVLENTISLLSEKFSMISMRLL